MIELMLCCLLQQDYSDAGAKAVAEFRRFQESVEAQLARTAEEMYARDGGPAEWARLNRRFEAERAEFMLKSRRMLADVVKALQSAPDDRGLLEARVQLAEFSTNQEEHRAAFAGADKLVKTKPGHAPYRVVRAAFLRLLGRLQEAAEGLAKVLKEGAADAPALAYAGLVAYDLLDADAAVRHLREALKAKAALRPALAARVHLTLAEEEVRARERAKDDLPRVEFATARGKIVVELFENEAPNTVANFIELVESKFYEGVQFHRVEPNFVIQSGDPLSKDNDPANDGLGGPGYTFKDELGPGFRRHFRGSLSMANSGRDTNGSQFFITHRVTEHLDGKHTVFGRVIEGMSVVDAIRPQDAIIGARIVRKRPHEYRVKKGAGNAPP